MNTNKMIYVFGYLDRYKIGVTENIEKRLAQLSCGCPNIKCLYSSKPISNPFEVEKVLHKLFAKDSLGGEWFSNVDLSIVNETINKYANYKKIKNNTNNDELTKIMDKLYPCKELENEVKKMKEENEELAKFTQCVQGLDIPNRYSDLVYSILLGDNTVNLRKKYKAGKFESFRKYLTDEQNNKISGYFSITTAYILSHHSFEDIRGVLESL